MRELGRRGGHARAAKLRALKAPPEPLGGTILAALERLGFSGVSWAAWRVFLKALFGLELTADELVVYRRHTARDATPTAPGREAWVVVGRRGGKSRCTAPASVTTAPSSRRASAGS